MKYRYYTNGKNLVVATATFDGKIVRGVAKCAPEDTFNEETGRTIAKMRVDQKIAQMRVKRAAKELGKKTEQYAIAVTDLYQARAAYEKCLEKVTKE